MTQSFFKQIGKLQPFEIKNSSLALLLIAPGVYGYSVLISYFNENVIEIPFVREFFFLLFLVVGLLPLTKWQHVLEYYGLYVFLSLLLFQHHLTNTVALNDFSIDYLLGTFIALFGAILLLSNRVLIIIFSSTQLIHMTYRVVDSDIDIVTEGAILISITTIFIYSFIILNGFMRYRRGLEEVNKNLEKGIRQRTKDLEDRAKELYERNKDLEEFAYVVSHDLKRPLRNIHTLTGWVNEMNKDKATTKEDITDNLVKIQEQVEQMDLLINGILNYSLQMEKEQMLKKVNLDSLIRRLARLNSSDKCTVKVLTKLPNVMFNESQILQVFQNLIQNAIKHNNKKIVRIYVDCRKEGNEFVFMVGDNGPGIDKKYHKKIFHLFQKLEVNTHVESIGIGLALVKKIIERNGGRVWLTSKKNVGTTFFLTVVDRLIYEEGEEEE